MKLKLSLSRRISLGFAMSLPIVLAIGGVSIASTLEFRESARVVAESHRIMTALARLLGDVASAESEARGFVVTGDERYLALHRQAVADAKATLREVRGRVMSADIEARLDELDRLARLRMERLDQAIQTRRHEGFDAALAITGPGKELMDDFRRLVAEICGMENTLLEARARSSHELGRTAIIAVLLCSLFAAVVAAVGTPLVTREVARRERLEREVLEVCEREPRRIGQDLHDGVCQHLTGISLLARSLHQTLAARGDSATAEADRIARLIGDGIDQVRRVSHGLHPVAADPAGLRMALDALAKGVNESGKIACVFDCPSPVPVSDPVAATHLYRIAQEAVQNAIRHARPRTITISLRSDDRGILLKVADDGRGMAPDPARRGLGLEIMRHRARGLRASLHIDPVPGSGTVVACHCPWPRPHKEAT